MVKRLEYVKIDLAANLRIDGKYAKIEDFLMSNISTGASIHFKPNPSGLNFAGMNCHYLRYPLEYFLDAMQNFGIRDLELFATAPHFYLDDVDDAAVAALKNGLCRRDLNLICFTTPQAVYPMNIAINKEKVRKRSVAFLKKAVDMARRLDCGRMVVGPGSGFYNENKEISWGFCRESLCELAEYSQAKRVRLMLEPLTPQSTNLINTSADAARMIAEVASANLAGMIDFGVMTAMNETVDSYFDALGERLEYVHFNDGPGTHLALGDGRFPLERYAADLKRHGYRGYCSFEFNDRKYYLRPDEAMKSSIRWLKQAGFSD
jgi:protein FrlC